MLDILLNDPDIEYRPLRLFVKKRRTRFMSRDNHNLLEFQKTNTHPNYPTQPNSHEMS